ncbi:MAG: hypothetical protein ACO1SV_00900 [Fimbriimonas sp.]
MSRESRWVRLNVDWAMTKWLEGLPWPQRAVWPLLLCHVKVHGNGRGWCKEMSATAFARMHDLPLAEASAFLEAAVAAGALLADAEGWRIAQWETYQSPDAWRKRQARAAAPTLFTSDDICPVACHATETETWTETVEKALRDTPQFRGAEMESLEATLRNFERTLGPDAIRTEAVGAQRWLQANPHRAYRSAERFFGEWLKRRVRDDGPRRAGPMTTEEKAAKALEELRASRTDS